jgi:MFS family permease
MTRSNHHAVLLVTLAIFLQVFLSAVDTTVISTAMPTVVAALGGMRWYSWVFSAYLIASTIATPIAGKLSDQFSRKGMYLCSISAFLAASMLCGLCRESPAAPCLPFRSGWWACFIRRSNAEKFKA